ncbi:ParA family protein [Kitasatospora sp. MBT66]|uniref:ParA family protein n=1 Tax=Kitasatospora sp. MBT66 TaxID=1444769 RepID=UPI0011EA627E|nr:ParA family protein [Kitasatospora sp. MBT66]
MTLTIALVNLKPGVGKSTSAVFLGQALYEAGDNPLVVDADKGRSTQRWEELAGGFHFPVISKATRTLHTDIPDLMENRGSLIVDVPQVEDHAGIARSALRICSTWVLPIAPSIIEVDRMFADGTLVEFLDNTQELRTDTGQAPADVVVLLNRTNTARMTKGGPDADVRQLFRDKGFVVLDTQIPHNDDRYRQSGGQRVRAIGTPYERVIRELKQRQAG